MIRIEDLPQHQQELVRRQIADEDAAKRPGQVELTAIAAQVPATSDPVPLEGPLHDDVMAWADKQTPWPWVCVHSRMDCATTTGTGVADFIVFGPYPLCIIIEAKAGQKKQSPAQLLWAARMRRIGWKVHVAHCMAEVLQIVEEETVRMIMR